MPPDHVSCHCLVLLNQSKTMDFRADNELPQDRQRFRTMVCMATVTGFHCSNHHDGLFVLIETVSELGGLRGAVIGADKAIGFQLTCQK